MAVIYTGGTFDLLHPGHVHLLNECRRLAGQFGIVTVSLNTDEFVASYKGHAPVMHYEDRAAVLLALRSVDRVIPNVGGPDSKPALLSVNPDVIVVGSDWAHRDYHAQMQFTPAWLHEHGIEVVYIDLLPERSSTNLRRVAGTTMLTALGETR